MSEDGIVTADARVRRSGPAEPKKALGTTPESSRHTPIRVSPKIDGARERGDAILGLKRIRVRRGIPVATRQIATLLRAGFTLERALDATGRLSGLALLKPVLADVLDRVRAGTSLAAALAAHPDCFGAFYRGMVSAGERSGQLAVAFDQLASHLEHQAELRAELQGALLYPAIMVVTGAAAVVLLLTYVIPRFATLLGSVGAELPWTARALVSVSDVLSAGWWVAALLALGVTGVLTAHRNSPRGRLVQDTWLLRVPVIGPLRARLATQRATRSLAGALKGGIPLLAALDVAADSAGDAAVGHELRRAAEGVRRGQRLGVVLEHGAVLPPLAVEMIAAGEESGRLPDMLEHVARTYRKETRRRLNAVVALVEPAVIVLLGVAVGLVALALLQTIYGIGSAI